MDRGFFKDLNTERLLLRNITPEDADFFLAVFSNPVVNKYLYDEEPIQSLDEAMKWIDLYNSEIPDHNRWVIIDKETSLRLGTCGFHNWDKRNNRIEIGYDLLPEYWGKGYMREALTKAIDLVVNTMNIHRIYALTHTENARSIKILEKLGFKKEGLLKDHYFFRGKYYDHFLYSLIKREFESNHHDD